MERLRLLASFAKIAILSGIRGLESHTTDTAQDNNTMHAEPRAARVFLLAVDRRGPVIVAVITLYR